jgi:Flp pilus assembly protein TadB
MEEKKLSGEESLQLIRQMIQVAKDDHHENGDGWLIWGWLLFLTSVSSVILSYIKMPHYIGWTWTGMLVLGLVIYTVGLLKKKRREKVQTYVQELLYKIGNGFFISLFALVAASYMSNNSFSFGYYYILYAFWMFIHGSAIRFRPLIIGAWVNWAAAIAIFLVRDFKYDMTISALAVLAGYLIPGYMLRADYRKKMKSSDRIVA